MRRVLLLTVLLVPVAALVVALPLVVHGCSCGHDFDFHVISWMEASAQFKAGVWPPAWAFSPAWNAGEPRFVFYPPMSWTLGALLGMVLPWGAVPIVYTWLTLAAAGLGMYSLARELNGSQTSASIAAAVYMANPYMVFTAYERTAYAELLAAAWLPLLLAAVLPERVMVLRVALPVALVWLTNAPAAVMGCYALAVLATVRLALMWRVSTVRECAGLAARVAGGVALGLGLAAFYVIPAAYERGWVQIAMAMVSGMRIEDNFLFHHTGDGPHDEVLHSASVIALVMLVTAALVLTGAAMRLRGEPAGNANVFAWRKRTVISVAVLTAVIGLLLTPLSAGVWRVAPEMAFLQFPWRFTAVLAAAVCAVLPLALGPVRIRPPLLGAGVLVLVAGVSWPAVHQFRQQCDDEDTVAARLSVFKAKTGTDPTDEYTPGESDNDALGHADPPFWLGQDGDGPPPQGAPGQVPMHFTVDADTAEALVLNLRAFPPWVVRLNGAVVRNRIARADGLIAFPVPAGGSQIDIVYAKTKDLRFGEGISLLALCGVAVLAEADRRRARNHSSIIRD